MSGYISTVRRRPVNKNLDFTVEQGRITAPEHFQNAFEADESLLTYRSGDRFSAEINGGAVLIPGTYLLDERIRSLGDYGHTFDHRKVDIRTTNPRSDVLYGGGNRYRGPLILGSNNYYNYLGDTEITAKLGKSDEELVIAGSSAIAQSYPTKPSADLFVAVAELLREGLPSAMFGAITRRGGNSGRQLVRDLSGDYLNYLFGITPLVREADKLIKAVSKIDQLIAQLVADSGSLVRRSREISTDVVVTKNITTAGSITLLTGTYTSLNPGVITPLAYYQTLSTRIWFSGAFRYWLPDVKIDRDASVSSRWASSVANLELRQGIYGLRATPKAVWNLLPFSWLVDWFVNVSDLFENADAATRYGLVMPYGYVMCESKLTSTLTADFGRQFYTAENKSLGSVSSMKTVTRQQRIRATPYGFGLKDVDMNPIQWSIMSALALQGGRR